MPSPRHSSSGGSPTVCVVEDYPDNRLLVSAVLAAAGIDVTCAEDGASMDALLAGGTDPDLFLIDLSLPHEDGISILQRLRRCPRLGRRPMLAMTAHTMAGDAERGLAAGFDAYITKPIDVTTLAATILRFLAGQAEAAVPA